jgi:UDP-N-acetylglucosamine 2-epimerase (non-hydrolysing)
MRDTTERPESIEAGTVKLVGADRNKIVASVHQLLTDEKIYKEMAIAHNLYGDGRASIRIKEFLESNDLDKK